MQRIHFDFSDSLLPPGSACASARVASCSVALGSNGEPEVSSLERACPCDSPLRSADTCGGFSHPISLITHSEPPPTISVTGLTVTHLYSFYHALFPSSASALTINASTFYNVSACGTIVATPGELPLADPISAYS